MNKYNRIYFSESLSLKVTEATRKRMKEDRKIISFGLGESPYPTPVEIRDSTIAALRAGYTKYSNKYGLSELRELIKKKLSEENGIECDIQNIVMTTGAKQAIYLSLLALLEPEDEAIIIAPCYPSYIPQLKLVEPSIRIRVVDLKKNDFSLDIEAIEKNITSKTKLLILNTPHNPTGKMFSKEQLLQLAGLAIKHDFYLLSDEVYEKLVYTDQDHFSLGSVKELAGKLITVNGFSKAYSMTGWRLGYVVAPLPIAYHIAEMQHHVNTNVCTFIQKGACAAFSLPADYLSSFRTLLQKNALELQRMISRNGLLSLVQPQGSQFCFINISGLGLKSDEFCAKLVESKGVATTPGIVFGENWDDHIRISLGVSEEECIKGIQYLGEFVHELQH